MFIGRSLKFQIRVLAWVLPDNQDMYIYIYIYNQYNSSCENVFLSNLVYSLNPYNVCQEVPDNLSIDYSLLVKHCITKGFIPFQENKLAMNLFFTNQMNALY